MTLHIPSCYYSTYPPISPAPASVHSKMPPLRAYQPAQLKIRSTNNKTAQLKLHKCKERVGVLTENLTEPADEILFSFLRQDSRKCCCRYLHLVFLKEWQCTERRKAHSSLGSSCESRLQKHTERETWTLAEESPGVSTGSLCCCKKK